MDDPSGVMVEFVMAVGDDLEPEAGGGYGISMVYGEDSGYISIRDHEEFEKVLSSHDEDVLAAWIDLAKSKGGLIGTEMVDIALEEGVILNGTPYNSDDVQEAFSTLGKE